MAAHQATERLYFNADRTKLVPEGDPDARSLACTPGDDLPEGLKAPAAKAVPAAENKAVPAQPNKGAK